MKGKIYKKVLAIATVYSVFVGSSLSVSAEGLSDVFDADYYAEQYPDVVAEVGSEPAALLNHFVTYGVNEGKQGIATFNVSEYKNAYADLQAVFGDDWDAYVEHYFTIGINEHRTAGVYGTVTRTGNAIVSSASSAVPESSGTIQMIPSWDPLLNNGAAVYEQVYSKIAALDINDDVAVKELDSYVRNNINTITGGEEEWKGSIDFTNGETLIIESGEVVELDVANSVEIYRGINCYNEYSNVYSLDAGRNSFLNRKVYTNGVISEVTK